MEITYFKGGRHNAVHQYIPSERRNNEVMKEDWVYRRGDIYFADLSQYLGSEQGGTRPVVVIQNNTGNYYAPTLIVATVTSRSDKKLDQPTHFLIRKNSAFTKPSVVQLEQLFTIDKQRVLQYLGKATAKEMTGIERAMLISLALGNSRTKHKTN